MNLIDLILVYVDDMIILRNDKNAITNLKIILNTKFTIKHLGNLRYD